MIRALLLIAFTLPAAAQQAPPAEPKKEPERRPLNLQLDNPSSFATVRPAEKAPEKGLPALGGDARVITTPRQAGTKSEGGPYPKDTNPGL